MKKGRLTVALLLLLAPCIAAETPGPIPKEPASDWLQEWNSLTTSQPITSGSPEIKPELWQRTWGIAGANLFATGSKMAPNGIAYDPSFNLDLLLNIALTDDRRWYLFTRATFWTQAAGVGITNDNQGIWDFSKRQFDIDGGVAWNYCSRFEGRAYLYSYNNLNRGKDLDRPFGYNDGFAVENRYYLPSTSFDKGLYRYLGVGYYLTKDQIGADGQLFKPSVFLMANLALDFIPECFYAYSDIKFITRRAIQPKLLLVDAGLAIRPFTSAPDVEFRLGVDSNVDVEVEYTRALLYGNVRIVW